MKRLLYILRLVLAALLLLLLAMAPAMAQTVVYKGDTTPLAVDSLPGDSYEWEIFYNDSIGNFATKVGNAEGSTFAFVGRNTGKAVNVTWLNKGTYFFKVTATNVTGCTSNLKVGIIRVKENLPTATIAAGPPVCAGAEIKLKVTLTGTGPWEFIYTDGVTEWTVNEPSTSTTPPEVVHTITIDPGPSVTTDYWIVKVKDKNGTYDVPSDKIEKTTQVVYPLPTPSTIYHN